MKSMPATRLTAFWIGRVIVVSIVSGETLPYATVTLTTGGANDGKSAIAKRGAANRPRTTIASESIATATRRRTANPAIPTLGSYASSLVAPWEEANRLLPRYRIALTGSRQSDKVAVRSFDPTSY